ncbi:endonuclease/exonuclease/phosphatase family protein [Pyrinomonas methylaliphatogenes]|jgi:endonuclease/exonuclease/phosphatase family metal-dependent hydrolase|nr:endonuclease/exonuclease/phosphatase family protein [Pyrinomonas methylaliphatogenes]MBX5478833.1 endonuclease/exonuclease/phosphatase family protein [Pyrinomonas methylaliphatogenes]
MSLMIETDVERGDFRQRECAQSPQRLIVATFNIRYAVGQRLISGGLLRRLGLRRPRRRSSLVARNICLAAQAFSAGRHLPCPEVIALQEADRGTKRAGGHHIAYELAQMLGMCYVHAAQGLPRETAPRPKQWYLDFEESIAVDDDGDTGVALLSRLPLLEVERIELPWFECAWRPRVALAAQILMEGTPAFIFCVHIDPHAAIENRLVQHEKILAEAEERAGSRPIIIMGDFNTLSRRACEETRDFLESRGYFSPQPTGTATWRSGPIRLHTDWIFVRGLRVVRWGVARSIGKISDHWPVWAEVEL